MYSEQIVQCLEHFFRSFTVILPSGRPAAQHPGAGARAGIAERGAARAGGAAGAVHGAGAAAGAAAGGAAAAGRQRAPPHARLHTHLPHRS